MVEEESIQRALDFIKNSGCKIASSKLVSYMESKDVPFQFRTTEITTRYKIIPELKKRNTIKISKYRHGQRQFLSYNDKSEFYHTLDIITRIENHIKRLHEMMMTGRPLSLIVKEYVETWIPSVKSSDNMLKDLSLHVILGTYTFESANLLNNRISKTWRDVIAKDFEVRMKMDSIRESVKSKKQG